MRTCAIMCAYNETPKKGYNSLLENSVNSIINCIDQRRLSDAVIVNDGSTDDTYNFIEERIRKHPEIKLIGHRENMGKAKAFLTGLKNCSLDETDTLVTLDADMENFTPEHLSTLTSLINPYIDMSIGLYNHLNSNKPLPIEASIYSGLRAIKMKALNGIYNPGHQEYDRYEKYFGYKLPYQGYRLEKILESIVPNKKKAIILLNGLCLRRAGEGPYDLNEITDGVLSFYSLTV